MPLDHYVSQVHLKNWNSPKNGHLMHATRKSDLFTFTPKSKDVCRIQDGSTNAYLKDDRVIEKFLKIIEPKYNISVKKLLLDKIDRECIYSIAGFISYILTCSPGAMRINSFPVKNIVEETAFTLDSAGLLPPAPSILGGKSLTELIENGKVEVKIDKKYPQAIGIKSIMSHVKMFGNFTWEILINPYDESPFFTSDYPVALYEEHNFLFTKRIFPLTPYLAVKIHHNYELKRGDASFNFSKFKYSKHKISRKEVAKINRLIVQCAEDIIFYKEDYPWVKKFIKKHSNYYIEPRLDKRGSGSGKLLCVTQKIEKGRKLL